MATKKPKTVLNPVQAAKLKKKIVASLRRQEQREERIKAGGDVNLHGIAIAALNRRIDRLGERLEQIENTIIPPAPHVHPRSKRVVIIPVPVVRNLG